MPSYSNERREAMVAKLMPPRNLPVREVAQQEGISEPVLLPASSADRNGDSSAMTAPDGDFECSRDTYVASDAGCFYVAFGRPYLIQALNSMRSLRKHSPGIPVCILTNSKPTPPAAFKEWDPSIDVWLYVEAEDEQNRNYKTDLFRYTPFSKTLFLDCDTEILNDITPAFGFLDYWDMALHLKDEGYAPQKEKGRQIVLNGSAAIFELPHWNSGVILFRRQPCVSEFFKLWNQYYRAGTTKYDQVSLVEALFRCSCRVLSLDARWNGGRDWGSHRTDQKRYILHYMRDIPDELGKTLITLDVETYGREPRGGIIGAATTEQFVTSSQISRLNRSGHKWQARWRRLVRFITRQFTRS